MRSSTLGSTLVLLSLVHGTLAAQVPIVLGDSFEGRLESTSEIDALTFDDLEGTLVSISLRAGAGLVPSVRLVEEASGVPLLLEDYLSGQGSSSLRLREFPLPASGGYRLEISASGTLPNRYSCATRRRDARANLKASFRGVLELPRGVVEHAFLALEGSLVTIRAKAIGSTRWNPAITEILGPGGGSTGSIAARSKPGQVQLQAWPAASGTGRYTLRLGSRDGSTGELEVAVTIKPPKSKRRFVDPGLGGGPVVTLRQSGSVDGEYEDPQLLGLSSTRPDGIGVLFRSGVTDTAYASFSSQGGSSWTAPSSIPDEYGLEAPLGDGTGGLVAGAPGANLPYDFHPMRGASRRPIELYGSSLLVRLLDGSILRCSTLVTPGANSSYSFDPGNASWTAHAASVSYGYGWRTHNVYPKCLMLLPGLQDTVQMVYETEHGAIGATSRRRDGLVVTSNELSSPRVVLVSHDVNQGGFAVVAMLRVQAPDLEVVLAEFDPSRGWAPTRVIHVLQGVEASWVQGLRVSVAEDRRILLCLAHSTGVFFPPMHYVLGRGAEAAPFRWDSRLRPQGVWHPWARALAAARGGDFVVLAPDLGGALYVSVAREDSPWSDWTLLPDSDHIPMGLSHTPEAEGDACLPIGPGGSSPFLLAVSKWVGNGRSRVVTYQIDVER